MLVVRPAERDDLAGIARLASAQEVRVSTLPRAEERLAQKIDHSRRSLTREPDTRGRERYLFVLVDSEDGEDGEDGKIRGVAGIDACAGNGQPFYNYRRDALIHASHELGVSRPVDVLYPSHGLTGHTLLCSFMIDHALRETDAFELLSRARLLFIARHRFAFANHMVVEIQGVQTGAGEVPFWDSLGRHFFNMDFATADQYSSELSKTFIAELMPPNPIYVTLLSEAAQEALAQPHALARKTSELLQREGFQAGSFIDIFDGGPVLEARTDTLKTIVSSHYKQVRVSDVDGGEHYLERYLVAAGEAEGFRCVLAPLSEGLDEQVRLSAEVERALGCVPGEPVMVAPR